jgi:hypothetical protein
MLINLGHQQAVFVLRYQETEVINHILSQKDKMMYSHQVTIGLQLLHQARGKMTDQDMLVHQDLMREVMKYLATLRLREMMSSIGILIALVIPLLKEVKANVVMRHQDNLLLHPVDIVLLPGEAADHQVEVAVVVDQALLLHEEGDNSPSQLQIQNIKLQDSLCHPAAPKIKTS